MGNRRIIRRKYGFVQVFLCEEPQVFDAGKIAVWLDIVCEEYDLFEKRHADAPRRMIIDRSPDLFIIDAKCRFGKDAPCRTMQQRTAPKHMLFIIKCQMCFLHDMLHFGECHLLRAVMDPAGKVCLFFRCPIQMRQMTGHLCDSRRMTEPLRRQCLFQFFFYFFQFHNSLSRWWCFLPAPHSYNLLLRIISITASGIR